MKHFRVDFDVWSIEYDRAYLPLFPYEGLQPKRGWTVYHNRAIIVELEPSLLRALWRAFVLWREQREEWAEVQRAEKRSAKR